MDSQQNQFNEAMFSTLNPLLGSQESPDQLVLDFTSNNLGREKMLGLVILSFLQNGNLRKAVEKLQELVQLTNPSRPEFLQRWVELAKYQKILYAETNNPNDWENTRKTYQKLLQHAQTNDTVLRKAYAGFAQAHDLHAAVLQNRYGLSNLDSDIEAALTNHRLAVEHAHSGQQNCGVYCMNWASSLLLRARRSIKSRQKQSDLQEAISLCKESEQSGLPSQEFSDLMHTVALCFMERYIASSDLADLSAALEKAQTAVNMPVEIKPELWHHLAVCLNRRYHRFGDPGDLHEAFKNNKKALDMTISDADRCDYLSSYTALCLDRHHRSKDPKDLQTAVSCIDNALSIAVKDHPERHSYVYAKAVCLRLQYLNLADGDFSRLEKTLEEAVKLVPQGHPIISTYFQTWGMSYHDKYKRSKVERDLDNSIEKFQQAIDATDTDHPYYALHIQRLASVWQDKYLISNKAEDLTRAFDYYQESVKSPGLNPFWNWDARLEWARLGREHMKSESPKAYRAAFDLLPEMLWIGNALHTRLDNLDKEELVGTTADAISDCLEVSDVKSAIELAEQGMSTTFNQILQLRATTNLTGTESERLRWLSSQLLSDQQPTGFEHEGSVMGRANLIKGWAIERDSLIRAHRCDEPGFLRPKKYQALSSVSKNGPVVILTTNRRHCDAIVLVGEGEPIHVPLKNVVFDELLKQKALLTKLLCYSNVRGRLYGYRENMKLDSEEVEKHFESVLNWIWVNVVQHVYDTLEQNGVTSGRLWWYLVGAFARVPLHAADKEHRFIQSYTSTLEALLNAQQKDPVEFGLQPMMGVVGVPYSSNSDLPGVKLEIDKITSVVGASNVHQLLGQHATVEAVKAQLQATSWVHLACHGLQNPKDHLQSHLKLHGGNLQMRTILNMPLPRAECVFLAACETVRGDNKFMNESFHLGGAFIAAGYRSAIGTLWGMTDEDGPLVAETVYSHLFANGRKPKATETAEALHLAVKKLRDEGVSYHRWVPFIHIGV
ncbi:CHAT domain-containing protein [Mycena crocata]|nr:CHAT domain-containing protein [Mycena crocata]